MYVKYIEILFLQDKTYITKPGATKLIGENYLGYLLHPPNNYLRGGGLFFKNRIVYCLGSDK